VLSAICAAQSQVERVYVTARAKCVRAASCAGPDALDQFRACAVVRMGGGTGCDTLCLTASTEAVAECAALTRGVLSDVSGVLIVLLEGPQVCVRASCESRRGRLHAARQP
jgi:hypothetical protein